MAFDRLVYIDHLEGAGTDESVARAHAEALREALGETVATKADLADAVLTLDRGMDGLDRKIEATAATSTIRAGSAFLALVTLIVGLKYFG